MLVGYEFLNGVFDSFLVGGTKVFVDFGVKRRVSKLPNCFLFGAPNDSRAAFVGCFDDEVIPIFEICEGSPFIFGKVGEFGVAIKV